MKWTKRILIWLVGMLVIVLLSNTAGSIISKVFGVDILLPTMRGYSRKMTFPVGEPTNEKEAKALRMKLGMRALLSNDRLVNKSPTLWERLLFEDFVVDETIFFTAPEGLHDFSEGSYICACDETNENVLLLQTVGLIDVEDFVKLEGTDELIAVLAEHPEAEVRMEAYTIEAYHVMPVSVTVRDADSGMEYQHIDFPADGDAIKSDTCFIANEYHEDGSSLSLHQQLVMAKAGERATDRLAAKLMEKFPYGQANFEEEHTYYGFGSISAHRMEVSDEGYGMLTVIRFDFMKGLLGYTAVLGGIMTVIMLLVFLVHDRKEN